MESFHSGSFFANLIASSSGASGKNLLNMFLIWLKEAFLSSTCTSHLPGLNSAGSSFSLWFVVMKRIRPSWDLTPSSALSSPEKVTLLPYRCVFTDSLSTKIPSISSSKMIECAGASFKALFRPSSSN